MALLIVREAGFLRSKKTEGSNIKPHRQHFVLPPLLRRRPLLSALQTFPPINGGITLHQWEAEKSSKSANIKDAGHGIVTHCIRLVTVDCTNNAFHTSVADIVADTDTENCFALRSFELNIADSL